MTILNKVKIQKKYHKNRSVITLQYVGGTLNLYFLKLFYEINRK